MTFGEHLEELRKSLGKALLWLGVGLGIGLLFANRVVRFVEAPLSQAIVSLEADRQLIRHGLDPKSVKTKPLLEFLLQKDLTIESAWLVPMPEKIEGLKQAEGLALKKPSSANLPQVVAKEKPSLTTVSPKPSDAQDRAEASKSEDAVKKSEDTVNELGSQSHAGDTKLLEHIAGNLHTLKRQLILRPLKASLNSHKTEEGFLIWIKAGLLVGAVVASPMIFYHIWTFIGAGLHRHERNYFYTYLPVSVTLFVAGVSLAFFVVLRYVLEFLLGFNANMDVDFQPRLSYYMNFVLLLPLGFGVAFQLPIVMLFLQRIGIFETQAYVDSWRIAVLVICVLSMILTPADVTSMIALVIPLCLLYGIGILMCKWMPRGPGLGSQAIDPV